MINIIKAIIGNYYLAVKMYILYLMPAFIMFAVLGLFMIRHSNKKSRLLGVVGNFFIINSFMYLFFAIVIKIAEDIKYTTYNFAMETDIFQSMLMLGTVTLVTAIVIAVLWYRKKYLILEFDYAKKEKFDILTTLVMFACIFIVNVIGFIKFFFGEVTIESIIFQMNTPLDGTANMDTFVAGAFIYILYVIVFFVPVFVVANSRKLGVNIVTSSGSRPLRLKSSVKKVLTVIAVIATVAFIEYSFQAIKYFTNSLEKTTMYEEYYVDKDNVNIVFPEEKRNLIMIYLESMENSYSDMESENILSNLTLLAEENINFSDNAGVGGFDEAFGCKWTMGALLGSSAAIPYNIPLGGNAMEYFTEFLPGLDTTIGEILYENGYKNVFMCGSDITFAGRDSYFLQHGNYELSDYFSAIEEGYIEEDYKVWWGHEDEILFERAKDKILRLAENDQPFNFTMLTVDTHFEDGYVCGLCGEHYDLQYSNVIKCADNMVYDFVEWAKQQDFYENTNIVIVGDHSTMDKDYFKGYSENRTIYNCFINAVETENVNMKNRTFTTVDIFPTVLGSMGVEFEGNRLGLGTNLFSDKMTIPEEIGLEVFKEESAKKSEIYSSFLKAAE